MVMYEDSIRKLYIEPTSMCNLNCKMCFRNSWIEEEQGLMSSEVISKIYKSVQSQKSIEKVVFAGMGEPLIHAKISEMVHHISQMMKETEIITNGTVLKESVSDNLIDAGLTFLWVSIDSSHIESSAQYSDVVFKNIEYFNRLRKGKCKLGFTFVLTNPSIDDLGRINEFADRFNADQINLSQIIPCELIENLNYDGRLPIGKISRIDINEKHQPRLNYCPFIEDGCCFIKWNGEVVPCMQLLHSSYTYLFNEKRKVMSYCFGNIKKQTLSDIWNSDKYRDFRKKVRNFEFPDCTLCDGCDDRKENRTDCMYNEIPTCGACLWAQNIARCP